MEEEAWLNKGLDIMGEGDAMMEYDESRAGACGRTQHAFLLSLHLVCVMSYIHRFSKCCWLLAYPYPFLANRRFQPFFTREPRTTEVRL